MCFYAENLKTFQNFYKEYNSIYDQLKIDSNMLKTTNSFLTLWGMLSSSKLQETVFHVEKIVNTFLNEFSKCNLNSQSNLKDLHNMWRSSIKVYTSLTFFKNSYVKRYKNDESHMGLKELKILSDNFNSRWLEILKSLPHDICLYGKRHKAISLCENQINPTMVHNIAHDEIDSASNLHLTETTFSTNLNSDLLNKINRSAIFLLKEMSHGKNLDKEKWQKSNTLLLSLTYYTTIMSHIAPDDFIDSQFEGYFYDWLKTASYLEER